MASTVASSSPCASEASTWRECLKGFDYSPDRQVGACGPSRDEYYSCIRLFRISQGVNPDVETAYKLPKECVKPSEELHECMMTNAHMVAKCRSKMDTLTKCHQKFAKQKY